MHVHRTQPQVGSTFPSTGGTISFIYARDIDPLVTIVTIECMNGNCLWILPSGFRLFRYSGPIMPTKLKQASPSKRSFSSCRHHCFCKASNLPRCPLPWLLFSLFHGCPVNVRAHGPNTVTVSVLIVVAGGSRRSGGAGGSEGDGGGGLEGGC